MCEDSKFEGRSLWILRRKKLWWIFDFSSENIDILLMSMKILGYPMENQFSGIREDHISLPSNRWAKKNLYRLKFQKRCEPTPLFSLNSSIRPRYDPRETQFFMIFIKMSRIHGDHPFSLIFINFHWFWSRVDLQNDHCSLPFHFWAEKCYPDRECR